MIQKTPICKLCGKGPAVLSHVIPKFAATWIKKVAPSPYLRAADKPNLRKEDGIKERLLCVECENMFSKLGEHKFAERIFQPFRTDLKLKSDYGGWLLYFAVSLAWRTSVVNIQALRQNKPHLAPHVDDAIQYWAAYLKGEHNKIQPYEHHLFLLGEDLQNTPSSLPKGFFAYTQRAFDCCLARNDQIVRAYTLLPGFVFWSTIHPCKQKGWRNTKILPKGRLGPDVPGKITDPLFGDFFEWRVEEISGKPISERQRQKMKQTFEDYVKSHSPEEVRLAFKPHLQDQLWQKKNGRKILPPL